MVNLLPCSAGLRYRLAGMYLGTPLTPACATITPTESMYCACRAHGHGERWRAGHAARISGWTIATELLGGSQYDAQCVRKHRGQLTGFVCGGAG